MIGRLTPLLASALLLASCGPISSASEVGRSFVAQINARDWEGACALRVEPGRDCPEQTRRSFEGGTATLLEPGEYSNGKEVTDNVNRYAIRVDGDSRVELAYYEVLKWGDDFRVDLQVEIIRR